MFEAAVVEAAVVEAAVVTRHEFTTGTFARPQNRECRVKPPFLAARGAKPFSC